MDYVLLLVTSLYDFNFFLSPGANDHPPGCDAAPFACFNLAPAEERLIAAAAAHSKEPTIALVSPRPPTMRWRQMAKQRGKRLVRIPLTRFSEQVIDRLRRFHELNGHEIRGYAARVIR